MDRESLVRGVEAWLSEADGGVGLLDRAMLHVEPDVVVHAPNGEVGGVELLRDFARMTATAFPDLVLAPGPILVDRDHVVFLFETSGTHQGPLAFIPPSGRQVSAPGAVVARLNEEGRAAEVWFFASLGVALVFPPGSQESADEASVSGA